MPPSRGPSRPATRTWSWSSASTMRCSASVAILTPGRLATPRGGRPPPRPRRDERRLGRLGRLDTAQLCRVADDVDLLDPAAGDGEPDDGDDGARLPDDHARATVDDRGPAERCERPRAAPEDRHDLGRADDGRPCEGSTSAAVGPQDNLGVE